ncbi:hypothetical protein C7E12_10420 [Stenotrophomonas maltophilia]|nr:hypothetical protein C7E12_10420 [Stenotrophomonas maltophilia]
MLRLGTLCSSVRRGTVRELAALRHPHLFALAGPAVLGSLKATQGQMPQLHPVPLRDGWMLLFLILIFQSALSEPSIAGDQGRRGAGV